MMGQTVVDSSGLWLEQAGRGNMKRNETSCAIH
jgi:hypothetical protein